MKWIIWFTVAAALFVCTAVYALLTAIGKYKRGRVLTPFNIMFFGLFVSSAISLIPIYGEVLKDTSLHVMKTVLFALHHTFQMFTLDADKDVILNNINCDSPALQAIYSGFLSAVTVIAPMLTFGFVISFFKNLSAHISYILHRFSDAYIFSELNEKSLALGSDIRRRNRRAVIVYTDVFDNNDEASYERLERAKEIRAICFKKDILAINFMHHSKKSPITFFIIGEDETENASQTLQLVGTDDGCEKAKRIAGSCKNRENTRLFVFSNNTESELLLNKADRGSLKIRRVNKIRSVINETFYSEGTKLFEEAKAGEDGIKTISAVVVGTGRFGTEMIKALSWYCQMDGYRIKINVFDKDEKAEDRFAASAPELMSEEYNGVHIDGEAEYTIVFHSGIETGTKAFAEKLAEITDVTYAFVSLGNDEDNIRAAVDMRMLFERMRVKPRIQTVVFNTAEKNALADAANFRGQKYNIDVIGDTQTAYSEAVILNSELEECALARHLKWGSEDDFWRYEYNYNSSVASAIHMKARIACKIPGADKSEDELTDEERTVIERLEHRRWNAYMRSEGYIYSGSPDKASRNDLGKMHHDLVNCAALPDEEKRKDSRVGTK
ncbi:MAG: hypothetical protein II135_06735 [Clostridia bacterium]|nr:hypothetical protein [Clostridia bacterium]